MHLHSTYWERQIKNKHMYQVVTVLKKIEQGQGERIMESTDDIHTQGLFLWAGTQKIQQL